MQTLNGKIRRESHYGVKTAEIGMDIFFFPNILWY